MLKTNSAIMMDFDGVMFDTVREAYVVAKLTDMGSSEYRRDIIDEREYELFRKYRYLITEAWNYLSLMHVLVNNAECPDNIEGEYHRHRSRVDTDAIGKYEGSFFRTRERLRNKYREEWLMLNRPFDIVEDLKGILDKYNDRIYILTTKDGVTVLDLLRINGINIDETRVYGNDRIGGCKSKGHIIEEVMIDRGIDRVLFVDDSIEHVRSCEGLRGVDTCVASWGYLRPGENGYKEKEVVKRILEYLGE